MDLVPAADGGRDGCPVALDEQAVTMPISCAAETARSPAWTSQRPEAASIPLGAEVETARSPTWTSQRRAETRRLTLQAPHKLQRVSRHPAAE